MPGAAPKHEECRGAADHRGDHERQALVDEPVVDVAGILVEDEDAGDRDDARRHRRAERPSREIALEVGVAEAARVAGEEDRRDVRAGGHE